VDADEAIRAVDVVGDRARDAIGANVEGRESEALVARSVSEHDGDGVRRRVDLRLEERLYAIAVAIWIRRAQDGAPSAVDGDVPGGRGRLARSRGRSVEVRDRGGVTAPSSARYIVPYTTHLRVRTYDPSAMTTSVACLK
jgi:hypothetical protein